MRAMTDLHFSGIAGAGMNPLARLMAAWGRSVQGSDRSFDRGEQTALRETLTAAGIRILPQDGSAIVPGIGRCVHSAAVEDATPEMIAATRLGIPRVPRPALLAEVINAADPGVAVAGTAGKSTITGMIAWCLRRLGHPATILGGAALAGEGTQGAFAAGPPGGLAVAEACESDGTLVGYRPSLGIIHNITRDHGELPEIRAQFARFAGQCRRLLVNAACSESVAIAANHPHAVRYGLGGPADLPLEAIAAGPDRARGILGMAGTAVDLDLPQPGLHTLENAAAALAAIRALGGDLQAAAAALATFPGVHRRFEVVATTATGIRVVDDYAHNGDKIRAAIAAAQAGCDRLVAVFQPHGFGPARFLRPELRTLLPAVLRPQDRFCYAPIYFAGGTVARDLTSADLAADLPTALACAAPPDHPGVLAWIADQAHPGDTVLIMGARDPALPRLARAVADVL
jgi:UDP-N-acetylmuramate--alanine ligase